MKPFKLERYFAQYEFKVKYLLSPSDCESLSMSELLEMAEPGDLRLWDELKLGYTESQGHPVLRAAVAGFYQNISPESLVIAAPEEAIFIAMNALLKPGDHVIALFPAYQSLYEVARSLGCEVTLWTLLAGEKGWQLDFNQLERSLQPNTRLLVVNFPHNPTGFLPTRAELEAIVKFARWNDLALFSDEMYRLLEYDPKMRLPAICDLYEDGISLSGLSKAFALPGLRLGWLASQNLAFVTQWLTFKDYTTICSSAPSEILGLIGLHNKEKILVRNLGIIQNNVEAAGEFFASHPDQFSWIEPKAGSVAFPIWRGSGSVDLFCQEVLEQQGVMVVPGSIFEYPGNHFRIGLGRLNLPEALRRLGEYLSQG